MKKLLLLAVLALGISTAKAQDSYTASNGRVYKVGDTIKIGKGSGQNGTFSYMVEGSMSSKGYPESTRKLMTYTNSILKQIKIINIHGSNKAILVVHPYRHHIDIEPAIEAKEVIN